MVGEEAGLRVVVYESGVERLRHRGEVDAVAAVGEYLLQALGLIGRVAEYEQAVAVGEHLRKRFGDDIEVFVVEGLGRGVELQDGVGSRSGGGKPELEDAEAFEPAGEILRIHHLKHGVGIPFLGDGGRFGILLGGDVAHRGRKGRRVGHDARSVVADKLQQRHSVLPAALGGGGGHYGDFAESLLGKLRLYVERAYGVYLVVEEVEAVGKLVGVGEDVEDRSAAGELPRLVDIVDMLESQLLQAILHLGDVALPGCGEPQGILLEIRLHGHPLGERVGIGHYPAYAPAPPAVDGFGAEDLLGRVDTPVFDVAFVAARKKRNLASGHPREVVVEIAGRVGVVGHYYHGMLRVGYLSEQHGGRRAPQAAQRHAARLPVAYEFLKGLQPRRSGEERGGFAEGHHFLRFAFSVVGFPSGVLRRMASYWGDSRMATAVSTTGSVRISTATRPPSP